MSKHLEGLTGVELDVGVGLGKDKDVREAEKDKPINVKGKGKEVEVPESPARLEQEIVIMEEETLDVEQEK